MKRDFVIAEGLEGPGRFLGCNVGVRVIDHADWYGEGEVKIFRDGDTDLPTICGTGLEDYVGSGVGHGPAPRALRRRAAHRSARRARTRRAWARSPTSSASTAGTCPTRSCSSATSGSPSSRSAPSSSSPGQEAELEAYEQTNPVAGEGWLTRRSARRCSRGASPSGSTTTARTAYVYCREPQAVPRVDVAAAIADIERRPYEERDRMEAVSEAIET